MKPIIRTTLLLLALLLPSAATAYDFEVDGIYYNIINGNEAEVTYKSYSDYNYFSDYSGDIAISSNVTYNGTTYSVTTIGSSAFEGCSGLTRVTIPNSVTSIGWEAFYGCNGLTSVTIPNSVTSIGYRAFYNCSGMTSVTVPNSVTSIGEYAFYGCSGLTSVTLGNSVTSIGWGAFSFCSGLTSMKVESGNPKYDSRDGCNAIIGTASNTLIVGCKNTIIPYSVTSIGDLAFYGCSGMTSVTIPNSVTFICLGSFSGCSGLTSVTIPNSVTYIGEYAFSDCSGLTSVTIPNSVTSIGSGAFYGCSGLTRVEFPNSVTFIGGEAFYDCRGLTSVTCFAITPPTMGDYYAFSRDVTSQATLYVPDESVSAYQSAYNWKNFSNILAISIDFEVDGFRYHSSDGTTAGVVGYVEDEVVDGWELVIPETVTYEDFTFTVTEVAEGAFDGCYGLTSVVIPNTVTTIGEQAFLGCTELTSVTFGNGVTAIGSKAFNYCNALRTVTCLGTVPPVMASTDCFTSTVYNRATLRVPRPAIDAYSSADYWYRFVNIEGYGSSGPGDVNGDGLIGIADVTAIIDFLLGHADEDFYEESADVNGNGIINIADITELIDLLLRN